MGLPFVLFGSSPRGFSTQTAVRPWWRFAGSSPESVRQMTWMKSAPSAKVHQY